MAWKFDVSHIEARHATIRLLLKASGNQTHTMSSRVLASVWASCHLAKRQTTCRGLGVRKPLLKTTAASARPKRNRRRARSAWQCSVAERSKGSHADFRVLHAAYQELPPEETENLRTKARLLSEAADGTAVRRVWPFRNRFNKAVAVARQQQRRIQWHRRRDLQGDSDGQVLDPIITDAFATQAAQAPPEEMVAAASRAARFESAMLRDAGRAAEATLASFRASRGSAPQPSAKKRCLPPNPCTMAHSYLFLAMGCALWISLSVQQPWLSIPSLQRRRRRDRETQGKV